MTHTHADVPVLEPFATRLRFRVDAPLAAADWGELIREFARILCARCATEAGYLIGHIKGFAELAGGGYLRFSAVAAGRAPDVEVRGAQADTFREINVDLNVHVYGARPDRLREFVREAGDEVARGWHGSPANRNGNGREPAQQSTLVVERHDQRTNQ